MPEKISILKESGETLVSNIVSIFMIPETGKRYIITTENAVDPHGLTVLHVSEIVDGSMQKVATDDEWSAIKTIMRAIISGNVSSYKYLPVINSLNAVSQYSRDISVSASASKQMIDNYNAADKSVVETSAEAAPDGVESLGPVEGQPPIVPSTIFPTDGPVVSNDDEVVPGIAELNNAPVAGAQPNVVDGSSPVGGPVNQPIPTPVPPVAPVIPTVPPVEMPVNPAVAIPSGVPPVPGTSEANILTPPTINSAMPNNVGPEATAVNVAVTPVVDAQVNPPVGIVNNAPVVPEQPLVMGNNLGLNNEVQVVTPSVVIPDAQIVQNAQNTSLTNDEQINFNATPSFDPNATLDEVVVASQQMFMEGVKNLVVTIQEKVYRDLYSKEEELKNREAAIVQKEQELGINNQVVGVANVVSPVASVPAQNVSPTPTLNGAPQVAVVQPTVVQASNDVI